MKYKLVIVVVVISVITGLCVTKLFSINRGKREVSKENMEIQEKEEQIPKEETKSGQKQQELNSQEVKESSVQNDSKHTSQHGDKPSTQKNENKSTIENEKSTTVVEKNISESKNDSSYTQNTNPPVQNNSSSSGIVDSNGNNKPVENVKVIDNEPWIKAGVSKGDYYSKPVYSWARIDYDVLNCGSIENCEILCMKDAEELAFTENVSCIQVFTYSGKYLGEMLKRN